MCVMNKVKNIICFIIEKGFSCFYFFKHQHYFHIFVGYENEMKVVKLNLESLSKLPETMIDLGPQNVLQEKDTSVLPQEIKESPAKIYQESEIKVLQEEISEVYYVTENIPIKDAPKKVGKQNARKMRTSRILRTPKKPPTKPPTLDLTFIERFATAWRCKICQKISSTKFLALDHREEAHPVAMQLK